MKQNGGVLELFSRFRRGTENRGFNGIQTFFHRTISNNK